MLNRRTLTTGALGLATASSLSHRAAAADGKPVLVFMGNAK
jgi:hypothetical protein